MVLTIALVHIFQQPFQTIKTYYNQIRQKDEVVKLSELIDEHIGILIFVILFYFNCESTCIRNFKFHTYY